MSGLWRDWRLGWRNLGRNPRRTALAWGAIAIAQVVLVWLSSFLNGYTAGLFEAMTGPMLGHLQVHALKYRDDNQPGRVIPGARALVARIKLVPGVAAVSERIYGPVLATQHQLGHVGMVTGVDVAAERKSGGLLDGLPAADVPGPHDVLVGEGLARDMHVRVGGTLVLMGQAADGSIASGLFRVKAIVPVAVDQVNQTGIIMNLAAAGEFMAMEDRAHELVILARSAEAIPGVAAAVRVLPGVGGLEVSTWDQLAPQMAAMIKMIGSMNGIIIVLVFITTIAGVANTMLMATFERSHEFGMLLALGVKPGRLVRMLFLEAVALGLAGVVIGSVLGVALAWPGIRHGITFGGMMGSSVDVGGVMMGRIMLILRLRDVLVGVAAVLVTSVLATIWPARRLSRLEPVEGLRA